MAEQSNILDIVKSKLIQANTDTTSDEGRKSIQLDISKLLIQFDNIASQTNYNSQVLLDEAKTFNFQIGEKSNHLISVTTDLASNTTSLGGTPLYSNTLLPGETVSIKSPNSTQKFSANTYGPSHIGSTVSGKVSYFDSHGMEISPNDTNTKAILDQEVLDGDVTENNGKYIMNNPTTFYTGEEEISFTIVGFSAISYSAYIAFLSDSGVTLTNASSDKNIVFLAATSAGGSLQTVKYNTILTSEKAGTYQEVIDTSLTELNEIRSNFGSGQNQIESAVRNLMTQSTNIKSAESIIRDVDYASESANFNKLNIIVQAGSYAQSQALQIDKQIITQLLK
jgi:flagellin